MKHILTYTISFLISVIISLAISLLIIEQSQYEIIPGWHTTIYPAYVYAIPILYFVILFLLSSKLVSKIILSKK